jgi:SAM-dependent methyltransferase
MKVISSIKIILIKILSIYDKVVCKKEYKNPKFNVFNERPVEYGYVFKQLAKLYPKTVLDVGTGITALPHLMSNCGFRVTAIDNITDYWANGMINRHYYVIDDDITKTKLKQRFDLITCISVLEHIEDHQAAIKSMFSLLNPGGHLILTFPYNERQYVENVYDLPESNVTKKFAFITQAYSRNKLNSWLVDSNVKVVEQEYWQFFTGDYWTCGDRITPPVQVTKNEKHQISCVLLKKGTK